MLNLRRAGLSANPAQAVQVYSCKAQPGWPGFGGFDQLKATSSQISPNMVMKNSDFAILPAPQPIGSDESGAPLSPEPG